MASLADTPSLARIWGYAGLATGIVFLVWAAWIGRPDFPLDDAYITLHNAKTLIEGDDPNYGVSPLVGATSTIHLALVAALALIFDLVWAGAVAAWLATAAYVAGLGFLARQCKLAPFETALLIAAGVLSGFSFVHLMNGIETGLAMAAVLWAVALAAGRPTRVLPALLGLLPFIRPELALLSVLLAMHQAVARWREGERAAIAGDAAVALSAAAPWLIWMWLETGAIVPLTAAAKRAFFAQATLPLDVKIGKALQATRSMVPQLGPLLLGIVGLWAVRAGRLGLLFAAGLIALFTVQFPTGMKHNWNRYLYVLVPLLVAGSAFGLAHAAPHVRRWRRGALIAVVAYGTALSPLIFNAYTREIEFARIELAGLATWVERHVPAGARIAVHDAGYIAFATDRPLVDIVGLKTPASQPVHAALTAPSAGARRGAALAQILGESDATYVVLLQDWDRSFGLSASLRAAGCGLEPVRGENAYRVYRVAAPGCSQRVTAKQGAISPTAP